MQDFAQHKEAFENLQLKKLKDVRSYISKHRILRVFQNG